MTDEPQHIALSAPPDTGSHIHGGRRASPPASRFPRSFVSTGALQQPSVLDPRG